jgi:hypothetical protein
LGDSDFFGGSSLLGDTYLVRLHIVNGLHVTETNALRVPVTKIALKILSVNDAEIHRAKWTDRYTGAAADANIVIDHYPVECFIPGNGLYGTNRHTGGVLTLLAGHGDVESFCLPLYHLYPASTSVGYTIMENRADDLTKSTPGTLFWGYREYFTHGFHSCSPFILTNDSNDTEFNESRFDSFAVIR